MKYTVHKAPIKVGIVGVTPRVDIPDEAMSVGIVPSPQGEMYLFYLVPVLTIVDPGGVECHLET